METKPLLYKNRASGVIVAVKVDHMALRTTRDTMEVEHRLGVELRQRLEKECDERCIGCKHLKLDQQRQEDYAAFKVVFQARASCELAMCPHEREYHLESPVQFDEWGNLMPFSPDQDTIRATKQQFKSFANRDRPENSADAW